ncbi:U3_assoc_6 domain-containing protein [Cephalotus follicularis]|uniref:U3_assoc_6 domain-containing protein n=1 Tax=Cephalotus follicularis TaxID=3775 RepID=A0A1Q3DD23_CEPFO|nr:U3_assoc_6 domain-containing protein [Cephalotus follicularis]
MADVVQYRLERMVDELDDLEKRGYFTRREISEIVKQRRKFEYRLKRPSPLKQDFTSYIEYEMQLDALRRLRKKAVAGGGNNKKIKKSVSDFSGVARIVELYRMAVMRFKGDVELWFRYLEFCRERRNGRMKKALAQVMRFHPKVPGVWIYAAAWEFDHNLNYTAAHALMLSGLRMCPASEDLWVEYLRMELTYLNKLKARKVALGEDRGTLTRDDRDADDKQWTDENNDLFLSLDEERRQDDNSTVENGESGKKMDFRELGLKFFKTIYSGAVEALPSSFSLRKRMFEILDAMDVAHSEDMRKKIVSDMKRDFATDPEYWDWLARLEVADCRCSRDMNKDVSCSQLQKAFQVYDEAIKFAPSAGIFNTYTKFLMDIIALQSEETEVAELSSHNENFVSHLLSVFEKAEEMECLTEDIACQFVSFYLQLGRLDDARKLAEKLCSQKLSNSVKLMLLRASIEVRCVTRNTPFPNKGDMISIFELLRSILTKVSISEAESLWLMALKFFANQKQYFNKLVEIAFVSITKYGGSENGFSVSSAIVSFVLQKDGIQQAREIYMRFLALPRPGLSLYKNCIELESNLASVGDKDCLGNARKLYESVLTTYDQNVSLWRDYHSMEIKLGTSETAAAVYWRARKTLKDFAAFIASQDPL